MSYIILIIIILWVLWHICKFIVIKIRDKIEDRIILKTGLKKEILSSVQSVNNTIEQQLNQIRASASSFKEFTFRTLPGIEDRIDRDTRKQNYIHNVLPYKKKKVGYKYRRR